MVLNLSAPFPLCACTPLQFLRANVFLLQLVLVHHKLDLLICKFKQAQVEVFVFIFCALTCLGLALALWIQDPFPFSFSKALLGGMF